MKRKIKRILKKKEIARKKAEKQIIEYFELAKKAFSSSKKIANDYVRKARNLAMKHKIRLPRELKRQFCKHCYSFLVPSKNLRVRLQGKKVVYYCLECRRFMRFPYWKRAFTTSKCSKPKNL